MALEIFRLLPKSILITFKNYFNFQNLSDHPIQKLSKKANAFFNYTILLYKLKRDQLLRMISLFRLFPDPEYDTLSSLFFVFSSDEGCSKKICKKSGQPTQNGSCIQEGKQCCQVWQFVAIWATFRAVGDQIFSFCDLVFGLLFVFVPPCNHSL